MKSLLVLWILICPFYAFANSCKLLADADDVSTGEAIGKNNYTNFDAVKKKGNKLESIFYTKCKDDKPNNHTIAEKWLASYLSVCDQGVIKKIDVTTNELEQVGDWYRAKANNYETKSACYKVVVEGLKLENTAREAGFKSYKEQNDKEKKSDKNTDEAANKIEKSYNKKLVEIDSDISGLTEAAKVFDKEASSLKARLGDNGDALLKRLQENKQLKEKIANIVSDNNYTAVFYLGMNMMPEYNDQGENEGFNETSFLGRLELDLRGDIRKPKIINLLENANPKTTSEGEKSKPSFMQRARSFIQNPPGTILPSYHTGITLEFTSENIVDCEKAKVEKPEEDVDCDKSVGDIDSLDFNDISHTVNASVYTLVNLWQSEASGAEFGVVGRVGLQSREKLKENGDSINNFHYVGVRWSGYDVYWKKAEYKGKNRLPLFYIEFSKAKFEDYAGLGKRDRKIFKSAYRPFDSKPFYVGLNINGGKGPDEIALQITYGFQAQRLFDIL